MYKIVINHIIAPQNLASRLFSKGLPSLANLDVSTIPLVHVNIWQLFPIYISLHASDVFLHTGSML